MRILKFGGSSVGNPERIKNVVSIVSKSVSEGNTVSVVVSAFCRYYRPVVKAWQTYPGKYAGL